MSADMLNLNQTQEELNEIYQRDYYWYMRSPQFGEAFHKPIGKIIHRLKAEHLKTEPPPIACLDVGCGQGQLDDYLPVNDLACIGIDGSMVAVENWTSGCVYYGRIEAPDPRLGDFDVIIFSGILQVLIKPERRVDFIEMYCQMFKPRWFIICDLEPLDVGPISAKWRLLEEQHHEAVNIDIEEVKRKRKILLYEV